MTKGGQKDNITPIICYLKNILSLQMGEANMNTKNLVFVALFSSIMGVLGLIPPIALSITPVPITLQSLGVMLAGGLLGSRLGALSQLVF